MITFFGASITAQGKGYAAVLKNKYFTDHKCKIFGFGSMHLHDAGITYLHKVLEEQPDLCFIDWFSTGLLFKSYNDIKIYLDTLTFAFGNIGCRTVFLFLPRKDHSKRVEYYDICKKYLTDNELSYIDLTEIIPYDEKYIRDVCHTTDEGGIMYAKKIHEEFKKIEQDITIPQNIVSTKYNNIKHIKVNQTFEDSFILDGDCEIIGFEMDIGPHSGLIQINDGDDIKKENFWDQWCYYTRRVLKFTYKLNGIIKITILRDEFDTSRCKKNLDFSKIKKVLNIFSIYFVGNNLSCNYESR